MSHDRDRGTRAAKDLPGQAGRAGRGGGRHQLRGGGGRAPGLHRTQRRRQVDIDQDADRHPPPHQRRGGRAGDRALEEAPRAGRADRHPVRPAVAALVPADPAPDVRPAGPHLPDPRRRGAPPAGPAGRAARRHPAVRPARAQAVAGPADAVRAGGQHAARAGGAVPGRADDRARPGGEVALPRPDRAHQRGAGHHHPADVARRLRHRAGGPAGDRDQPRTADLRRPRVGDAPRAAGHQDAGRALRAAARRASRWRARGW